MTSPGWPGDRASQAQPAKPQDVTHKVRVPSRPDIFPLQAGPGSNVMLTPGRALIALRAELAGRGLEVTGMTITRLHGIMPLAGGPVVRYCRGWLAWSAGRPSHRGRPLQTLHSAHDPAGAALRLAPPPAARDMQSAAGSPQ